MRELRDDSGLTLVEMLVALVITSVLLAAVVLLLTSFMHDNGYAAMRDQAQDNARQLIDRMSRELRNAATPVNNSSPGTPTAGLLEVASPYDVVFESVNSSGSPPSGDVTNEMQVRYCLDTNDTLWRQSTAPSSSYTTLPDTSACPSTSSAWLQTASGGPCCVELSDVSNRIGGSTTRPLLTYGPPGYSTAAQIKQVEIALWVDPNPGKPPGATELTSGVYLRNELSNPTATFTPTQIKQGGVSDVQLNGSASNDPNGQALTYQWYTAAGSQCAGPPSGSVAATTQQWDAGHFSSTTTQTFWLVVTDTAGLTGTTCQAVTVQ